MSRMRKRVAMSAGAALIALPFVVAGLLVPAAGADQGNSAEHSQRSEHSQSTQESPGSNGGGGSGQDGGAGQDGGSSHADHSSGNASTTGDPNSPQPASNADFSGSGANTHGPYDSTRDGSPSMNGSGGGNATGRPCAGCVGKADNKNPKGQMPDGSDANAGYECDRNHGIGRTNPAHTGCQAAAPAPDEPPGEKPPADKPPADRPRADKPRADRPRAITLVREVARGDIPIKLVTPQPSKLAITGSGVELALLGLVSLGLGGVLLWMSSRLPRPATAIGGRSR